MVCAVQPIVSMAAAALAALLPVHSLPPAPAADADAPAPATVQKQTLPARLPACACARRSRGPGSEEKLHNPHHHDPASSMPWRFKTGMHALHFCAACDNRWALSTLLARFPDAVDAR